MKIATFNIQNLFHRDRSLIKRPYSKCVADWIRELDELLLTKSRSENTLDRIKELVFLLGFDKSNRQPYVVMRKRAGLLFIKGSNYSKELRAGEVTDWNGWITLSTVPLNEEAIKNKARVISEADPDILILQEIEDLSSLEEFNTEFLPQFNCSPFDETVVLQNKSGNGQETGLLLKNGYALNTIQNYYLDSGEHSLFKQQLVQYEIKTPENNRIYLLSANLVAESNDKKISDYKRKLQTQQIANICEELYAQGKEKIILAGTLNAVPYCDSLTPLRNTNLRDISKHNSFNTDFDQGKDASYFRMGAYRMGVNIRQQDYLMLSPALFEKVKAGGLNRKAIWPIKKPIWSAYSSVQNKSHEASEHPVIWAQL